MRRCNAFAVTAALALVILLGGCFGSPRQSGTVDANGLSDSEAASLVLEHFPDATEVSITEDTSWPSLTLGVNLTVDDVSSVDSEEAVDFLLQLAWASGEADPTAVQVTVRSAKTGERFSLQRHVESIFDLPDMGSGLPYSASVSAAFVEERFGAWPGPAPTVAVP